MLAHSSALARLCAVGDSAGVLQTAARAVSSKYPRPKPRHYRRRLFEAAVAPVLPPMVKQCVPPQQRYLDKVEEGRKYEDYELALADLVRSFLAREEFRVMAVCQFATVPGRTLHFTKNQLRTKDIVFRAYGNKIMKQVFAGTPLRSLEPVFVGTNALLLGKTPEALVTIVKEAAKLNWIVPLVYVVDSRIVSAREADALAALPSLTSLYGETVQLLEGQLQALPRSLDAIPQQLVNSLAHIEAAEKETK